MNELYNSIPEQSVYENISNLIGQVYKLLPYKESNSPFLESHFSNVLLRLSGLSHIITNFPELITVISVLEAAKTEENFYVYRKAILDSCSTLKRIQEKYSVRAV